MYSLNCSYFKKEFETFDQLIDHVQISGMDPNYEITRDGECTGEYATDHLMF